jgi:hypothetical protein
VRKLAEGSSCEKNTCLKTLDFTGLDRHLYEKR